MRAVQCKLAEL